MNKQKISDRFTEIIASRLHARDQLNNGVTPPQSLTAGWKERYFKPESIYGIPYAIEINYFKIEVDQFVSMLMQTIDE